MVDDDVLKRLSGWIDKNRDKYEDARGKMSDSKFVEGLLKTVHVWLGDLMAYDPSKENPGQMAVYTIARTQMRFNPLFQDVEFMAQFEEETERYNEAVRELEEREG